METIALKMLSYVTVSDFQTTADALDELGELLEDSDVPDELVDQMDLFIDALDINGIDDVSDYASPTNDIYFDYSDYYGTYTFNRTTEAWVRSTNSSELKFVVPSSDGGNHTLSIKCSGSLSVANGRNGEVPSSITASFTTNNGDKLFDLQTSISEVDYDNNKLSSTVSLEYLSYSFSVEESLDGTSGSVTTIMKKGDVMLLTATAEVSSIDADYEEIPGKISASVNVLDSLFMVGQISNMKTFINKLDYIEDSNPYQYQNKTYGYPESYYEESAEAYNTYITASWNYDNSTLALGTIEFDYEYNTYSWTSGSTVYTETEGRILPILVFAIDDSRYDFEEYFTESAFSGTIDKAESLADEFEVMFDFNW